MCEVEAWFSALFALTLKAKIIRPVEEDQMVHTIAATSSISPKICNHGASERKLAGQCEITSRQGAGIM
jgi:hypothetical protein